MKTSIGNCLAAMALIANVLPIQVIADVKPDDRPDDTTVSVADIRLSDSGTFLGAVVDDKGLALADQPVQVLYGSKLVAEVRTDENGRYAVKNVRSGTHLVKTAKGQQVCRFWDATTAPPAARNGLLLVSGDQVVRGQDEIVIGGLEEIVIGGPEILMLGAFSAVSVVTVTSATKGENSSAVAGGGGGGPASP